MVGLTALPRPACQDRQQGKRRDKRMNIKRMRGRNHRGPGGGGGGGGGGGNPIRHQAGATPLNRNHVFDSSGPDLRVRGTAQQLFEKYLQLGRDATGSGDRVMAESYFQHAEHYFRILNAMAQAQQQGGGPNGQGQNPQPPRRSYGENGNGDYTSEPEEIEEQPPGYGDQPTAEPGGDPEPRQIPIAAAPPEGHPGSEG